MSDLAVALGELPRWQGGRTALLACAVAGAAGLLLTAVGYAFDPRRTMLSYLVAFLYFLGLSWQHTRGSALIGWVGDDARYLADQIHTFDPAKPTSPTSEPAGVR